jgi:hypothetical protein
MTIKRTRAALAAGAIAVLLAASLPASAEPQGRIVGTVTDFHGKFGLVVRDQRGALAQVTLHPGTVIKPEGLRLERGMVVSVVGQAVAQTFAAAEIVAPFEQWPTTRAAALAAIRARSGVDKLDTTPINASRPGDAGRWSQVPDQYSLPPMREPPR